jgi:hypothetical protein
MNITLVGRKIMQKEFELEVKEQRQLERDYKDWCRKYDPNYIVERDEEEAEND